MPGTTRRSNRKRRAGTPAGRRHILFGIASLGMIGSVTGLLLASTVTEFTPGGALNASLAAYQAEQRARLAIETNAFTPTVLSGTDAITYRKMFRLLRDGKSGEARALASELTNDSLVEVVFSKAPGKADQGEYRATQEERKELTRRPHSSAAKPVERMSTLAQEPKGSAAAELFFSGQFSRAFLVAREQLVVDKDNPEAHWLAGLSAWRLEEYQQASQHFSAIAKAEKVDDWRRAAGAFWAARAFMRSDRPAEVSPHFAIAAGYPRTFYGLLAGRALGVSPRLNWSIPQLDKAAIERLHSLPAGKRGLALLQIGETGFAEQELLNLARGANRELTQSVLAVAAKTGMAEVLFRLGNQVRDSEGRPYDTALFPLPSWRPPGGFSVDRALVFGVMRQESQFRTDAVSPAGARGLMQIMPATAGYIARDRSLEGAGRDRLYDAEFNIMLGQKYIAYLLEQKEIEGNLFLLAAAYNGGIGNVAKWRKDMEQHKDPLMFIESIPFAETRLYVERVLTNIWMYRIRLEQRAPSLERLAEGGWPVYRPVEENLEGAPNVIAEQAATE